MKKVLDMTEKEAKNYFMKNSSYFSMSLPEYLDFTNLLIDVDKKIITKEQKKMCCEGQEFRAISFLKEKIKSTN